MSGAKDEALQTLQKMPQSATWDEIMYRIYVRAKISEGLKDAEAGRIISQEELEKEFYS